MPPVFLAIAAALYTLVGTAAAVVILNIAAYAILNIGASLLIGPISKLFHKGPSSSSLASEMNSRTVTSRQAVAPWRVLYGANRVGGIITFLHTTGTKNEKLQLVITTAGQDRKSTRLNSSHLVISY